MAWKVTAEVGRFDEAADWFLARSVITRDEAMRLDLDTRQRAFWIGGGLQLTQIQRVFDEIGKAVESGEDFHTWRKRVRNDLRNDAHAETVFRNAVQRAYSAGRWEQMNQPDVVKWRPYFMLDAVLDTRTSDICRPLDGVTLPANHQFWQTHVPPLHHRCRTGLRNLRKAEAERRGITNVPPITAADQGFGLAPGAQPIWKPDPKKHDPALVAELEKKAKREPKAKKPKDPPKTHDPKYWEDQLRGQYGEAAPAVAWGRAMYERGLDRSAKEIHAELERLKAAGVPGLKDATFTDFAKLGNRPLRNTVVGRHEELRGYIALAEHSLSIQRGSFGVLKGEEFLFGTDATREAAVWYGHLLDKSVKRPDDWYLDFEKGARAFASPANRRIVLGDERNTPVAVHELAHAIEFNNDLTVKRSRAFLTARTKGEELKQLSDLIKNSGYGPEEKAWEDKFFSPYVGKDYGERATEITSMGYERMARSFGGLGSLAAKDWDMLHFLLGQLAGR